MTIQVTSASANLIFFEFFEKYESVIIQECLKGNDSFCNKLKYNFVNYKINSLIGRWENEIELYKFIGKGLKELGVYYIERAARDEEFNKIVEEHKIFLFNAIKSSLDKEALINADYSRETRKEFRKNSLQFFTIHPEVIIEYLNKHQGNPNFTKFYYSVTSVAINEAKSQLKDYAVKIKRAIS